MSEPRRMFRRSEAYIDAHGVLGGLIQDLALQQTVALDYEQYDELLVTSANRTSIGSATTARPQEAWPVERTPAAHYTVCRAGCARVFHCAQAAIACLNLHPHTCQRHGARQRSWGGACTAARLLARSMRVVGRLCVPRSYFRARCAEQHELACAMWGTRATCGTFGVGRESGTWALIQKTRSDQRLGALGGGRAAGLIFEGQASIPSHPCGNVGELLAMMSPKMSQPAAHSLGDDRTVPAGPAGPLKSAAPDALHLLSCLL